MESEKTKEIKKALEFNANEPIYTLVYVDDNNEQNIVDFADILTLINELESENESCYECLATQKAVIDELEKSKFCVNCTKEIQGREVFCLDCHEEVIKAVLTQFAERLKEKVIKYRGVGCGVHPLIFDIDETLKEFINKGDEER